MPYEKLSRTKQDKIIGTKQTTKAMNNRVVEEVYIAKDVDWHIAQRIEHIAKKNDVKIVYVDSKVKLGKACGIDVGASTVALVKE